MKNALKKKKTLRREIRGISGPLLWSSVYFWNCFKVRNVLSIPVPLLALASGEKRSSAKGRGHGCWPCAHLQWHGILVPTFFFVLELSHKKWANRINKNVKVVLGNTKHQRMETCLRPSWGVTFRNLCAIPLWLKVCTLSYEVRSSVI